MMSIGTGIAIVKGDMLPAETIAWSFIDHHQAMVEFHSELTELIRRARRDGFNESFETDLATSKE